MPYYGHHGFKQFIKNKPIRFGYKIWCLDAPLGYLVKFIPYQEKGSVTDKELGLGGSVVVDLLSVLSEEDKYKVYFDNFFTSLKLVDKLTEKKIGTTGTVRDNRIEKCPIMYQSIPSLTIPPPGNFFDRRIPHPSGKKVVQNPHPRAYKNELKPHPGAFSSIIHYKYKT